MNTNEDQERLEKLTRSLELDLLEKYGPVVTGNNLRECLGYPSMAALKQAFTRNKIPIPVFTLKDRRGKFALVKDVAIWLAKERNAVLK